MAESQTYFGISCPTGGDFYVCEGATSEFLGCCASNPCSDGSGICPQDDIRPATFNPDKYEELPAQDCTNLNRTKNWYTCTSTNPPFMGCCVSNPCANAVPGAEPCPIEDLRAANLSSIASNRRRFLSPDGANNSSSATSSPTSSSSTSETATTNTVSASASPSNGGNSQLLSTGAIIGISVAAVAALLAAVAYFMFRCGYIARRRKEKRTSGLESFGATSSMTSPPPQMSSYRDSNTPMGSPYNDGHWPKDGTVSERCTPYSDHARGHHRGHSSATYVPVGLGVQNMPPQELDSIPAPLAELDGGDSHTPAHSGWDSPPLMARGGYEYGPSPVTTYGGDAGSNPSFSPNMSPPIGSSPGLGRPCVSPRSM